MSEQGRCATCTWWQDGAGLTDRPRQGLCQITVLRNGAAPDFPWSRALAVDRERYHAALYTAPDFYCNQYEAKEGE